MTSDVDCEKVGSKNTSQDLLNRTKTFFQRISLPKTRMGKTRRKYKDEDDVMRKKIETARARLDTSDSAFDAISFKTDRNYIDITKDLPVIYFVVASDKMPFLAKEIKDRSQRIHQQSYTERAKKTFYSKQINYNRIRSEEKKRIRDLGADMGLRLEPIKSKTIPQKEIKPYSSRLHTTPVSVSEKSFYKSDISVLNYTDDLNDKYKYSFQEATSEEPDNFASTEENNRSSQILELPVIPNLDPTKKGTEGPNVIPSPEGSVSTLKKVHFAEGLPEITGARIDLIRSEGDGEIGREIQRHKKSSFASNIQTQYLLTSESSTMTRSLTEITPRSRAVRSMKPMSLPKIDVLTPIYDELLLKTLQTYCMGTDGPKSECDANALMHKMSVILHSQELPSESDHTSPNAAENVQTRFGEVSSDFVTKTESSKYQSELSINDLTIEGKDDTFVSNVSTERKIRSFTDEKPGTVQTPLSSSCFQMIPPGLTKEKSQSFQTLVVQPKDV